MREWIFQFGFVFRENGGKARRDTWTTGIVPYNSETTRGQRTRLQRSLAFESVAEGDGFQFHADGVHDGDHGAGFEYESREG